MLHRNFTAKLLHRYFTGTSRQLHEIHSASTPLSRIRSRDTLSPRWGVRTDRSDNPLQSWCTVATVHQKFVLACDTRDKRHNREDEGSRGSGRGRAGTAPRLSCKTGPCVHAARGRRVSRSNSVVGCLCPVRGACSVAIGGGVRRRGRTWLWRRGPRGSNNSQSGREGALRRSVLSSTSTVLVPGTVRYIYRYANARSAQYRLRLCSAPAFTAARPEGTKGAKLNQMITSEDGAAPQLTRAHTHSKVLKHYCDPTTHACITAHA